MNHNIIILGGGMVGSAIARDLKDSGYAVTVADRDEKVQECLAPFQIDFVKLDFSDYIAVRESIKHYDLVIGAVPGFMGYEILRNILEEKKNIVDISFMPEDSRQLFHIAENNGVTALSDAGVAPGLSNLIFGREFYEYDHLDTAKCFVGGLPQNPQPPWLYKSVFSPIDVIEEYTRPARLVENGHTVIKQAMTEIEKVDFVGVGELDAFNSDGLRSLLDMPIPNMVEKTLRFPGHIQKIIKMRDHGLFKADKIKETAKTLINEWVPDKEDYDQTVMRLEFYGVKDGKTVSETYDLLDYYDKENYISSMARTTGYTCTAVAEILLSNKFTQKGVYNLESLGADNKIVDNVLHYLGQRNLKFNKAVQ